MQTVLSAILLVPLVLASCYGADVSPEILHDNDAKHLSIKAHSGKSVSFTYTSDVSSRFVVFSATPDVGLVRLEVTNPSNPTWEVNSTVGRNPGLVIELGTDGSEKMWGTCKRFTYEPDATPTHLVVTVSSFDMYTYPDANFDVNVVLTAVAYPETAPIPGGCCLTCQTSHANPSVLLRSDSDYSTDVNFFQANLASSLPEYSSSLCQCDNVIPEDQLGPQRLQYQLYFSYVASCGSAYRRVIDQTAVNQATAHMTSLTDVLKYGNLMPDVSVLPAKARDFQIDATPGQGVVYTVVVTDTAAYNASLAVDSTTDKTQFMAAFAPYPTFHCARALTTNCSSIPSLHDCQLFPECAWLGSLCGNNVNFVSCDDLRDIHALVLEVIVGIFGLFLATYGHRHFRWELMILGFLFFTGVAYVSLHNDSLSESHLLLYSTLCGIVGAMVVFYYWFMSRGTAVVVIFVGLNIGVLIACIIFATSVGELVLWQNKYNFAMAFTCIVLVMPIVALLYDRVFNIVGTSFVGSYCFLMAVDYFVGSSFDDILLNLFRRATIPRFAKDYTGNLFAHEFNGCTNVTLNVAMLCAWVILTVLTALLQFKVTSRDSKGVPTSDRLDHQWCPTPWCCASSRRNRRRARESWRSYRPLTDVSGANWQHSSPRMSQNSTVTAPLAADEQPLLPQAPTANTGEARRSRALRWSRKSRPTEQMARAPVYEDAPPE